MLIEFAKYMRKRVMSLLTLAEVASVTYRARPDDLAIRHQVGQEEESPAARGRRVAARHAMQNNRSASFYDDSSNDQFEQAEKEGVFQRRLAVRPNERTNERSQQRPSQRELERLSRVAKHGALGAIHLYVFYDDDKSRRVALRNLMIDKRREQCF